MYYSQNSQKGLYQVAYPIYEKNYKIIEKHLPLDNILSHIAQDYSLDDGNGSLRMDVDILYEEGANTESDNILSLEIPDEDLADYRNYLVTVVAMIDGKLLRDKKINDSIDKMTK